MPSRWSVSSGPDSVGERGPAGRPDAQPVSYVSHPAALPPPPVAIAAPPATPTAPWGPPPWSPRLRFDPPGPAYAEMRVLGATLLPALEMPALGAYAAEPADAAGLLAPGRDATAMPVGPDQPTPGAASPARAPEPPGVSVARRPAVTALGLGGWAGDAAVARVPVFAEPPVAWPEPGPPPSPPGFRPAPEGGDGRRRLWSAEPVRRPDTGAARAETGRPERRVRLAVIGAVAAVVIAGGGAALVLVRRGAVLPPAIVATYNAPMMVLRAASTGQITEIAVRPGQAVEPATLLMTIHTDPPPDPAAASARARLDTARARLAATDDALTQPAPATEIGRARFADLRQQRASAAAELAAAQDAADHLTPKTGADLPVLAAVHGVVRSVETQAGASTTPGMPLVRLLDCDHAFLTMATGTALRLGQAVRVHLPDLPPAVATVRQSAGVAEPPDSLVVPLASSALGGACPVGAAAGVTPADRGG